VNGKTGEHAPVSVPASGASLDDAALSGPGTFRHGAALVSSPADLLDVALPFLDEGLSAGDLVVLSSTPDVDDLLRRELGRRARGLETDTGLSLLGARAPDVFTHARQYAHRAAQGGSGRVRVLSEVPVNVDDREEMRIEAVANHVMATLPVTTLCLYDTGRLSSSLVTSARATHPCTVAGTTWTDSPTFDDPEGYLRALPVPRQPLEDTDPLVAILDAPTLPELRHRLIGVLPGLVRGDEQLEDLRLGISEVAANAFRHGTRPVSGRLWSDGSHLVCEITDSGTTFDNPLAGFIPAHGFDLGRGGMGLWLARKLFDHVDLFPRPSGFTVRLSTRLR
jgi:anti-sigma regulatory factor (Ser/Thr protein kinase)